MSQPRTPLRVDEIDRIVAQRDALLGALKECTKQFELYRRGVHLSKSLTPAIVNARAAIARATTEKP